MGKTSSAVKQRYNEKAYDRLAITIPKGHKATIEAAARAAGESINQFTGKALRMRMGLEEWPEVQPEEEEGDAASYGRD